MEAGAIHRVLCSDQGLLSRESGSIRGLHVQLSAGRVSIPGPSGIFLRLTYRPARFARTLDWIVAYGPGTEGERAAKLGLPDTAIWEFVSAKTILEPV